MCRANSGSANSEGLIELGEWKRGGWDAKLKELIPSYGQSLAENAALCQRVRAETAAVLKINNVAENINNVPEKESVSV
jgi:hypothetical protein